MRSLLLTIVPMVRLAHAWCAPPGQGILPPPIVNKQPEASDLSKLNFAAYEDVSFAIKATIGNTDIYSYAYTAQPYVVKGRVDQYDTLTRIGSVTKLITVLAILLSEAKIGWEDSIRKHIPQLKDDVWEEVTISALAGHTSGLGRFGYVGDYAEIPSFDPAILGIKNVNSTLPGCDTLPGGTVCKPTQLLDMFNSASELPRSPNSGPLYSNNGFVLLGLALQNAHNESYEKVVQRLVIDPLQLKNTTFVPPTSSSVAILPNKEDRWFVPDFANWNPTGGLWSTPNELMAIMRAILDNRLQCAAQTRKWMQPRATLSTLHQLVGAPWEIMRPDKIDLTTPRVVDMYTKSGGVTGYTAYGILVPEFNMAVTINAAGNSSEIALREVLPTVMDGVISYADKTARQQATEKYVGTYSLLSGGNETSNITIDLDDGPGLIIKSFNMNGVSVTKTFSALANPDPSGLVARLYPTDPDSLSTKKQYWRMNLESNSQDQGWADELCISWAIQDRFRYAGEPLDAVNFVMDGGKAAAIELLGWRQTLIRE